MRHIDWEFIIVVTVILIVFTGFGFLVHQDRELKHQEIMGAVDAVNTCKRGER